jgi:uncharacterized OsmC-like protein
VGTLGGALEARKIDAKDGRLTAEVRGEVQAAEDGVLVIRKIHAAYRIVASEEHRATIERVHAVYASKCPVFRSLSGTIEITSSYAIVPE